MGCLRRQLAALPEAAADSLLEALVAEVKMMEDDPTRLIWQIGLPTAVQTSVAPYCQQLDAVFCGATAGLEMERDARRALRVALE